MMGIAQGLHWIRMPMPFALDHINLWALDDVHDGAPGWTVVDAGVATAPIQEAWQTLWQTELAHQPLTRMLVTHMHPDHVGNADWLITHFSRPGAPARLWMSMTDHLAAERACAMSTSTGGERAAAFFASHGLSKADDLEKIRTRGNYYATLAPRIPDTYRRLFHGQTLTIGARQWRCLAGYGHSPEHIALHCEADGLLISGDMLLPRISTNISVHDTEPEGDPLRLFLDSLDRMAELPADTLALPSHGLPFRGIHTRIQQLKDHHRDRLEDVRQACAEQPCSAADLLPVLFKRQLDLHQTTFAMGESVAHVNHLWHLGGLRRTQDAQGVWRFTAA
jgi:glyoxylase-like metal-dependent hydrolase (beta-lactamase superfamily II)